MELGFQFRISTSKKLSPITANGPWQVGREEFDRDLFGDGLWNLELLLGSIF